ncbi:hypothetical protein ACFW04_001334 [Cataglyphis niger]
MGTTENETGQNEPVTDATNVVKQMRKWGVHFDGRDPFAFLERLEELKAGYAFPESAMLLGLPELLRGDFDRALRTQFLPRRYQATLRHEISDRRQRPGESFKKYVGDILTLMRRAGGCSPEEKYERIYENMRAEIKRYMKVTEQEEIEELCRQEQKTDRVENAKPNVATAYNKEECCWRCKQRGHTRQTCKRPPRKFCSQCGQDGVIGRTRFRTLIDTGAEISFVNEKTAQQLQRYGHEIQTHDGEIQMANGESATIPGIITAPIRIKGETLHHKFAILPKLESPVLMGVDLWSQTTIGLNPPRTETQWKSNTTRCTATRGLTTRTTNEKEKLQEFLRKEFGKFEGIQGPTNKIQHRIRLKNDSPIKQRYRPRNPAMQAIIDQEMEDMEAAGVIEPSTSAWSSPVVLVKKKDGKYRFCIDFRKVNDATEKDAYPLPQVTATLEKLRGAKYLSTLDLKQGYWQVPLESESRPITAFTIPGRGLYQFKVMPFGLHSAPATFQRLLDKIISPALEPNVFVYLDDIIVISKTFDDHLRLLTEVFRRRLRDARLRLNPEKCKFCVDQLKYLGHVVDRKGIRTDPEKTLISAPVLACPDFARRFVLQTDASTSGLGAVLTQNFEEGERVITYASRTLNSAERNYSATELECLAVVWGIRRMKGYLEGKGTLNRVADALLRQPEVCVAKPRRCGWYQRVLEETERDPSSRPDFRVQNGKLYKHILHNLNFKETSADEQWKECVPKEQRAKIISQHHNEPTAGHLGIAKTIARIAEYFYWPGMFREIAAYVRTCPTCQAHKVAQEQPTGKLHATDIQKPWEQVTTDLVGPLPRSRQGHTWLFVMQDRFSKWVELAPLRQATAKATTRTITERVILRHGRPESILSDNGTQFVSKEFENRQHSILNTNEHQHTHRIATPWNERTGQ